MEEQAEDLARRLADCYGSGVSVEYVDIFSTRMDDFPSVLQVLAKWNVTLPIVAFDGEARFAGGISVEIISEALEKMGLMPLEEQAE